MDAQKILQMEKMLISERERVEKELSSLGIKDPASPGGWETSGGEIDHSATESDELADRQEEFEERDEELNALKLRYTDVTDALKKIEDGTYGTCEVRGEAIEEERLMANPAARTCIAHLKGGE